MTTLLAQRDPAGALRLVRIGNRLAADTCADPCCGEPPEQCYYIADPCQDNFNRQTCFEPGETGPVSIFCSSAKKLCGVDLPCTGACFTFKITQLGLCYTMRPGTFTEQEGFLLLPVFDPVAGEITESVADQIECVDGTCADCLPNPGVVFGVPCSGPAPSPPVYICAGNRIWDDQRCILLRAFPQGLGGPSYCLQFDRDNVTDVEPDLSWHNPLSTNNTVYFPSGLCCDCTPGCARQDWQPANSICNPQNLLHPVLNCCCSGDFEWRIVSHVESQFDNRAAGPVDRGDIFQNVFFRRNGNCEIVRRVRFAPNPSFPEGEIFTDRFPLNCNNLVGTGCTLDMIRPFYYIGGLSPQCQFNFQADGGSTFESVDATCSRVVLKGVKQFYGWNSGDQAFSNIVTHKTLTTIVRTQVPGTAVAGCDGGCDQQDISPGPFPPRPQPILPGPVTLTGTTPLVGQFVGTGGLL